MVSRSLAPSARRALAGALLWLLSGIAGRPLAAAELNTAPTLRAAGYLTLDRPVADDEIRIGVPNARTGRTAALGLEINRGAAALYHEINSAGGIHGRRLRPFYADDHYAASETRVQVEALVNQQKVFALNNLVGALPARAVLPMLLEAELPAVGAFTGSADLRRPLSRYFFNLRASYGRECESLVGRLIDELHLTKIASFAQEGGVINPAAESAIRRRGLQPSAVVNYPRNSVNIEGVIDAFLKNPPEAVIIGAGPEGAAAFLREAARRGFRPQVYVATSFVGTEAFIAGAGAAAEGVFISQVVPSPRDPGVPLVARYQKALAASGGGEPSYGSLEGYANALVLSLGLERAGRELTTEGLVRALESLDEDLGGLHCAFSPTRREGSGEVFLSRVEKGIARTAQALSPLAAPATAPGR